MITKVAIMPVPDGHGHVYFDTGLFDPRNHEWSQHFMVNTETAEIIGLTENGRTTVLQLKMNKPSQLAARKQWMLLELFP